MGYIIGIDLAKNDSDYTCLTMQFVNTTLEEMKELWNIGDEYSITNFHKTQFGLNEQNKLIISEIYENSNGIFMNMLVK